MEDAMFDGNVNTILVFQLLDDSTYDFKNVSGETSLRGKDADNIHHVEGKLTVGSKERV
jgi:hypothetical protein